MSGVGDGRRETRKTVDEQLSGRGELKLYGQRVGKREKGQDVRSAQGSIIRTKVLALSTTRKEERPTKGRSRNPGMPSSGTS